MDLAPCFFLQMKIRVLLLVYEYEARTMLNGAEKYFLHHVAEKQQIAGAEGYIRRCIVLFICFIRLCMLKKNSLRIAGA